MTVARRVVVLVDGEHHPPALRAAIAALEAEGAEVASAVFLGGGEKLDTPGSPPDVGVPAHWPAEAAQALAGMLDEIPADAVVELSGEPVVDAPRRHRLAAVALSRGVSYETPGSTLHPPPLPALSERPAVMVAATGKRTGKTAVSGALARHAAARGREPVVVAMGRGGPPEPIVIPAGETFDTERLLGIVGEGGHAASDFYEDAVMTGATTVGCFRVGDGPAGEVALSNVAAGVQAANELPGELTVLEGSGAALPPCSADAVVLIVPATAALDRLLATVPLKFVLADSVLVTFAGPPVGAGRATAVAGAVRELLAQLPRRDRHTPPVDVAFTRFRPHPLGEITGRRVLLATTAPAAVASVQAGDLEERWGARVVATSSNLADRPALLDDLSRAPAHDMVVTELKAAAVDVVLRAAHDAGVEAVLCDNRPELVSPQGRPDPAGLDAVFDRLLSAADRRFDARRA